jgi:hypothetical protein
VHEHCAKLHLTRRATTAMIAELLSIGVKILYVALYEESLKARFPVLFP